MKILITAPSLDERRNVSGISTVARQILENGTLQYAHFVAGRGDDEKAGVRWTIKQAVLPFRFFRRIINERIDIVHINTAFNPLSIARDLALVKAAKLTKRAVLLHVHGGEYLAREFKSVRLQKLAEKMLRSADAVLVLSALEKNIIENRWKNLSVKVLENAVSAGEIPNLKRNSDETGEKTIIFLGRLHESKGLRQITEACRILKNENFDFRFEAFGAGDLQNFFIGEMTAILGDKFHFGGVVSGVEKRERLARADVFVLPSLYGEGLPMALLEAMAAGCVVVASEMASIGAVVRNGVNGFTIEPRSVSQLVDKLKIILAGEIDLAAMRTNAQKTVAEKFNLPDYIEKLERIYAEINKRK